MKNAEMTFGASIYTIFLCTLFGGNGVAIKLGLTGVGPFTSAGIRFALAASALVLWAWYRKIPLLIRKDQWPLILIQCCLFTCQLSCFHLGLEKTTASHGALIANVLPFMVLILSNFFIPGDCITIKKTFGICLGFTGVVILFFDAPDLSASLQTGDLIVLTAVLIWSVSAVFVKRIIHDFHVVQITLYPMIFGIPFFFTAGYLWDDTMVRQITPAIVKALLYQSLVTAAFGFVSWNGLLKRFGASALHSFVFIVPLVGVFAGVMVLDEPVTPHLLGAICLIVTGIVVVNLRRPKKASPFPVQ